MATKQNVNVTEKSEVSYYLTGESVLSASASPYPASATDPTLIRITHTNLYGPVDSDIFVRAGDPKSPLGFADFDTVSDWQKAKLVSDTVLNSETDEWIPRPESIMEETPWEGVYETEFLFPPGTHLIEVKFLSRIDYVCSIILSNWEIKVRK